MRITIMIAIICFVCSVFLMVMAAIEANKRFQETHIAPKFKKQSKIDLIVSALKFTVIMAIPVLNILVTAVYLFCFETIVEKTYEALEANVESFVMPNDNN